MIVDSSALPEQVVNDVLTSAFDGAGQRCSALRVLCLQEDIADKTLEMLRGRCKNCALAYLIVYDGHRSSNRRRSAKEFAVAYRSNAWQKQNPFYSFGIA